MGCSGYFSRPDEKLKKVRRDLGFPRGSRGGVKGPAPTLSSFDWSTGGERGRERERIRERRRNYPRTCKPAAPMDRGKPGGRPRTSKKRTQPLERTLAILIQSMRGNKVVVEMKNDTEISGVLEETDRNMNLSMVDVRQTNPDGSVKKMNVVLVQGKMIRYVHIPDEVDAIQNLQDHMRTMDQQAYRRQMLKPKQSEEPPR